MEAQLQRAGWKAAAVHGDASQQQRTRAVEHFKVVQLHRHARLPSPALVAALLSPRPCHS